MIPPESDGPMPENPSSLTVIQGGQVSLKCGFYRSIDESMDNSCDESCQPGWTFNGNDVDISKVRLYK